MAGTPPEAGPAAAAAAPSPPAATTTTTTTAATEPVSASPVEMLQLSPARPELDRFVTPPTVLPTDETTTTTTTSTTAPSAALGADAAAADPTPAAAADDAALTRSETAPAIGAALDDDAPTPAAPAAPDADAAVPVTLLLTTGTRHPFRLDAAYLSKRGVQAADGDPLSISVYTMKELIWRDWRDEWDPRPATPSAIRLISFGRLLDDKSSLKECRLAPSQPNVVHMTVKPSDMGDDDALAKGKGPHGRRRGADGEPGAGCRCCAVM